MKDNTEFHLLALFYYYQNSNNNYFQYGIITPVLCCKTALDRFGSSLTLASSAHNELSDLRHSSFIFRAAFKARMRDSIRTSFGPTGSRPRAVAGRRGPSDHMDASRLYAARVLPSLVRCWYCIGCRVLKESIL